MTIKRHDNHSTEFGLWIRDQKEIGSNLGFITTNLDYIWTNYKTKDWMLIEEKRYYGYPKDWQWYIFLKLDKLSQQDIHYHGLHLLVFENTSPDDGKIWLDKKLITREELLNFLKFNSK
jgi:hypothetical protein